MVKSKELKEAEVIFYEGKKGESLFWQNLPNIQPKEAQKEHSALEQIGKDGVSYEEIIQRLQAEFQLFMKWELDRRKTMSS